MPSTLSLTSMIRHAVRRLAAAREAIDARKLNALRAALAPGLADAAARRFAEGGVMDTAARAAKLLDD